jgi:transposase InsO family protein
MELTGRREYWNRLDVKTGTFEYIKAFYSRKHRHPALGYLSTAAYEARHASAITDNPWAHCPSN